MNDPLVSVIMSVYNEKGIWLEEAIKSILNQTYEHLEFIIVLDNPKNTELDTIIREYSKIDKRIKYYVNQINIGLSKSLNFALSKCMGDYVARMDADDISLKDRIEKQIRFLKENELDLIGGNIVSFWDDNIISETNFPLNYKDIKKQFHKSNCMAHPTWFVKKEIYDQMRGYRDIPYCEDYDFLLRLVNKNIKMGNIEDKLLYYRLSPNSISRENLLEQKLIFNYLAKNMENINSINEQTVREYLKNCKVTSGKRKRYSIANKYATKALKYKYQKKSLYLIFSFLASIISLNFFKLNYLIKFKNKEYKNV